MHEITGRDISALLNPRPLVLVGASYDGLENFATIAWVTPLSHNPPLVAFALRPTSHTFTMIEKARCCSINIPDKNLLDTVVYCGNHTGAHEDKRAQVAYRLFEVTHDTDGSSFDAPSQEQAVRSFRPVPVVSSVQSFLICTVYALHEAGDHMLVCATVEKAFSRCAADDKNRICALDTLLVVQHDLFTIAESLFDENGHSAESRLI